ncbi:MAG: RNA 2',3'-cyclic phosphodiesterase [Magnetospirillum sp.]|nr:RNA 2',3'-cyclic phosphodiesterase [Magnetospirillum sp.]
MIRLFAGIPLDPQVAERLASLAAGIPGARWIEARNLHLTLRFIGDVDEGLAHDLHDALADIASPVFDLTVENFGTFGAKRPHTLWAGIVREPALERLRDKIESVAVRAGLPPEPRKFMPHVTLARLEDSPVGRIQEFIARNSPFRAGPTPVANFTLFRSYLSRSGAEYELVAEYPLR